MTAPKRPEAGVPRAYAFPRSDRHVLANGMTVIAAPLRRLPVVILSSSREENDLARSWDLGVNAYVVKPVDVDQFFEAVKTLGRFWAVFNEAPQDV